MIGSLLVWYILIQGFTCIGFPLAFAWFRHLPSRGYAVSKPLGILFTGIFLWWGGILHLWSNTSAALLTSGLGVLALGLWAMQDRWSDVVTWWRAERRFVLVTEALFLGAYVLWAVVRASQPQLQTAGGEKWMEIAFLNAVVRSPRLPPHDPWLSGYAISYYYLGYLLLGMLARLATIATTVAFNLGNATWFALVAAAAYGIVYDLSGGKRIAGPLLAPLMMLLTGNGEGVLEVLHARGLLPLAFWKWMDIRRLNEAPQPPFSWIPTRFFWWWQASRTIQDRTPWGEPQEVIDEFPAFSFTLGDMHPHLLALPFVLVAIVLALQIYREQSEQQAGVSPSLWRRFFPLVGWGVVLGALGALNTWDFPIYWALVVGAVILGRQRQVGSQRSLLDTALAVAPEAVVLGIVSIGLYFPFWLGLRSQAGGILPNLFNATGLHQFVVMFLPLLLPAAGVVVGAAVRHCIRGWQAMLWGGALMVAVLLGGLLIGSVAAYPYLVAILQRQSVQGISIPPDMALAAFLRRWWPLWPGPWVGVLLAIGTATLILVFWRRPHALAALPDAIAAQQAYATSPGQPEAMDDPTPASADFPALLVFIGLLLTLAPEFVYLKDVFMTRMNTIFKFYFQAWILWSLGGAWQLVQWMTDLRQRAWRRWLLVAAALWAIALGLVYTALAVPARAGEMGVPWTLDSALWLKTYHPGDYAAIQWLNANVEGRPVILETPGDRNRAYTYEGRISALTGLPSLLGWGGHQLQWRGNYAEPARREADIERLFSTVDPDETRQLLDQYDVTYVYIGELERQRYAPAGLGKFTELFPVVYEGDGVTIVRVMP